MSIHLSPKSIFVYHQTPKSSHFIPIYQLNLQSIVGFASQRRCAVVFTITSADPSIITQKPSDHRGHNSSALHGSSPAAIPSSVQHRIQLQHLRPIRHSPIRAPLFPSFLLKHELVDLINRDYNDFVNLSTKLVDVDGAVVRMRAPLLELRQKIEQFRDGVESSLVALKNGLHQRAQASSARQVLELLIDTFHVVSKVEKLIKELPSVTADGLNVEVGVSGKTNGQNFDNGTNERERDTHRACLWRGLPVK